MSSCPVLIPSQTCCRVEPEASAGRDQAPRQAATPSSSPKVSRLWVCCPWLPGYCTFKQKPLWVQSCLLLSRNSIDMRICLNYYCYSFQCGTATGKMEQSYLKCCRAQGRHSPNLKAACPYSQLLLTVPLQHTEDASCRWVLEADASVGSGTGLQGQLCPREMSVPCPDTEFSGLWYRVGTLHRGKPAGATAQPASVLCRDTAQHQPLTGTDI